MTTLAWIPIAGIAMSSLALVGAVTTMLSEETLAKVVMPTVALAAGSLLGGAFFHMLPEAVSAPGNNLLVFVPFSTRPCGPTTIPRVEPCA
jgi:zinc and cadmium transporter